MTKQYFTPNLCIALGVVTNEGKGLVVRTPNNTFCPFRFHEQISFICFPTYLENYFPTIQSFPLNLVYVCQLPDSVFDSVLVWGCWMWGILYCWSFNLSIYIPISRIQTLNQYCLYIFIFQMFKWVKGKTKGVLWC